MNTFREGGSLRPRRHARTGVPIRGPVAGHLFPWRSALPLVAAVAACLAGSGARAQDPTHPDSATTPAVADSGALSAPARRAPVRRKSDAVLPMFASPLVPAEHWAWDAARRLNALGLVAGDFDRGKGLVTRRELALLFEDALERAQADRPELVPLVRAFRDRFRDEFGDVLAQADRRGVRLEAGWFGVGYAKLSGRAATGVGLEMDSTWTPTRPIPDSTGLLLDASVGVALPPTFALTVEPELLAGQPRLRSGMLVGQLFGYLGGGIGRRSVRLGPGEEGGIVLNDEVTLDGFGAFTAQPFRFPWLFRALGPVQMESFFSKVYGGTFIRDPFFVAFRGSIAPHPRLTLGLNRAAMFGGRGNQGITLGRMMFLFTGGTGHGASGYFANDVLSADATWRPPTERTLPLTLYLEWGMDDAAGAFITEPAVIAGAQAAALPGARWLGLGVEGARFTPECCGHGIWYRNFALRQGWADYGFPVGHPLAGEGSEVMAWTTAALWNARLTVRAAGFGRDRGPETTLAPGRVGRSAGGWLRAELRLAPQAQLVLDGRGERGSGWSTAELRTTARILY